MLSLVLPTYNEAANITSLIDVLDAVLHEVPHEIIVVDDDSPDGTWKVAEGLRMKHPSLRVLRRRGRRGLSSAVVEGFDMARGDILAVMDADGQHDGELLLKLVAQIRAGAGVAIGSRYVPGGNVGEWISGRRFISRMGTNVAGWLSRVPVSDPLGGFFMLRTPLFRKIRPSLRPTGFKILLEILANIPSETKVREVPLVFRMRLHGTSKLSFRVHCEFLLQVLRLGLRRIFTGAVALWLLAFWTAIVAGAVLFVPRAWNLRLLYLDPVLRSTVETAMRQTADHEGWLLSDMELLRVTPEAVDILHREHMRRSPAPRHCTIVLSTVSLTCGASDL